jgi:hypothetical protein
LRWKKGWHFVIMEKIRPAQCGAALFGKETSQRGGSCIVSPAVMAAMGSILTNKYAEGLPGCGGFLCVFFVRSSRTFVGGFVQNPTKQAQICDLCPFGHLRGHGHFW